MISSAATMSLAALALCSLLVGGVSQSDLPGTTFSGYVSTNKSDGSELFYAYYEAQEAPDNDTSPVPVLLWLQVPENLLTWVEALGLSIVCKAGRSRMCQHVRKLLRTGATLGKRKSAADS